LKKIDADKALRACRAASEAYPKERRFRYQLDRAFDAAKDFGNAKEIYEELGAIGHAVAIYSLAHMYAHGEGVARDRAQAARLYRRAADLGNADAMHNLAILYDDGEGIARDRGRGAELIVMAIKKQINLGIKEARFERWSIPFRRELQKLLKKEGV
jgi:uncharacterized protein